MTKCQTKEEMHQLTQFTNINIPPGCYLDLPKFLAHRGDELTFQADPVPITYRWNLPALNFISDDTNIGDLDEAVKTLEGLNINDIDAGSVGRLRHLQRPLPSNTPLLFTMVASFVALFLVTSLIIVILWQIRRHRIANRKLNDPMYRYKDLLKSEAAYEVIAKLVEEAKDVVDQTPN